MRKSASEVLPRSAPRRDDESPALAHGDIVDLASMAAGMGVSQSEPVLRQPLGLQPLEPVPTSKLLAAIRDTPQAPPPQRPKSSAATLSHAASSQQLPLAVLTKNKNTKTLAILPTLGYIPFQGKSRRAREREATSAPPQRRRELGTLFARITGNPLTDDPVPPDAFRGTDGADGVLEGMNLQELMRIKASFKAVDADKSGTIDLKEFKSAMQHVSGAREVDSERLFMKIDANADGLLTWDEFLVYIVLHQQGAFKMRDEQTMNLFGNGRSGKLRGESEAGRHDDAVNRIIRLPDAHLFGRNKYIATSKAGLISCWDASPLRHLQTSRKPGAAWLTDACYLYRKARTPEPHHVLDKLAVFGIDRRVDLFAMKENAFEHEGGIELDSIPLCALFCVPRGEPVVAYGDDRGAVTLLDAYRVSRRQAEDVVRCRARLHSDWVTGLQYASDLGCILSSSLDGTLRVSDPERSLQLMVTLHGHRKGIHSFAWSASHHLLATAGIERFVNIWTLARPKPLYTLQGHGAPIRQVVVDDGDSQVISLDLDDVVKVWDIRTGNCIQTIDGESAGRYPRSASGTGGVHHSVLFFDDLNARLVSAHRTVTVWPALGRLAAIADAGRVRSHHEPLVGALYNAPFGVVISADASSISTWDVETGEQSFLFKETHPNAKISAMCLDQGGRRLITGASDGTRPARSAAAAVWNFTSGQAIREGESPDKSELTSVIYLADGPFRFIVGVGWNRKVLLWDDGEDKHRRLTLAHVFTGPSPSDPRARRSPAPDRLTGVRRPRGRHTDDILCVTHCPPGHIATCSYDGTVAVWNINSGAIRCRMRSSGPSAPLAPADSASSASSHAANRTLQSRHPRRTSQTMPQQPVPSTSSSPLPAGEALAVEKVLCLRRRHSTVATAGVDGYLRFWSPLTGAQIHAVHGGHAPGEPIIALATDAANTLLVSGDARAKPILSAAGRTLCPEGLGLTARGPGQVWEISGDTPPQHHAGRSAAAAPPATLRVAPLHHFVAQRNSRLASVELLEAQRLVVTAAEDGTVALWSLEGALVGTFGQPQRWSLPDPASWARAEAAPYDEADFAPHGYGAGRRPAPPPARAAPAPAPASPSRSTARGRERERERGRRRGRSAPPRPARLRAPATAAAGAAQTPDGESSAGESPKRGGHRARLSRSFTSVTGRPAAGVKGAEIFSQQATSEIPHSLRFYSSYLEGQVASLWDRKPSVSHRIDIETKPLAPVPDIPAFFQTHKLDKLFLREPSRADREREKR
eukprot:tig00000317_g24023.t1